MEVGHNAREQLKSIVERVERLETEIRELQSDRADIYKEAGGNGFDVPALKAIVRARREDPEKRREREAQIELYRGTLGID
ncbi:uncharacterized protein (UPF0335 family) [Bradyrhizobium diazoefficiens]